jgi:hypothetical protein
MNTAHKEIANLVHEAVSCREFSKDMRKSAEQGARERRIEAANEADRDALDYIRQAQEILEAMVLAIEADRAA